MDFIIILRLQVDKVNILNPFTYIKLLSYKDILMPV